MGCTLFALPFGNIVELLGIKKTVIIIRVFSLLLIILGITSILFDFKWIL